MSTHTDPPIIEMEPSFAADARLLETRTTRLLDRTSFALIVGVLMFGPLAFGATEAWSLALVQITAAVLGLLWCARQIATRTVVFYGNGLFGAVLMFAIVIAAQLAFRTTVIRAVSTEQVAEFVAFALLMFVASQLFFYGQRLRLFAQIMTWFGLAVSVFAILQGLSSNGKLYWMREPQFSSSIYGPYVNRNHYAGFMEMLVPLPLALCLSRRTSAGMKLVSGFAALLMSASLILSGSRGGTTAFVAEMVFFAIVSSNLRRRKVVDWKAFLFFAALAALLVAIDVSPALSRWGAFEGDLQTGRAAILRDGWHMFMQKPLLGWGLGTFPNVYPEFRTFYTDYYVNQAHNDPLQVLIETGLLGAIAMVWFVVALYRTSLSRLLRSGTKGTVDAGAMIRLAALTACTGIVIHSFVDFNLHIPANAALFFTLCAVACWGRSKRNDPTDVSEVS